ncbi:MAG: HAMP domain-containing sensor histidine kinase [Anaerolineae bacterium]
MNAMAAPFTLQEATSQGVISPAMANPEDAFLIERMNRLEDRLRQLEDENQALRQERAIVEALLSHSASELRTPMSLVLGYQQLMEANPRLRALFERDAEAQQLAAGMGIAVGRMQGVMDELHLLARVLSGHMEPTIGRVKIAEVLARALSGFTEPMRQRNIALRFERINFPDTIDADEVLLDVVFRHLMSNAIKYTPDGGSITLAARVIPGATPGGVLRFSVTDTGIGIPADDLERIFDVYTSTPGGHLPSAGKTDFLSPGVGLGLVVCKRIAEAHGGRLWAESPGYDPQHCPGSTFIIVLPVKERQAA